MQSQKTLRTRQETRLSLLDKAALALLFLYVFSDIMGGAIRYYSVRFGMPMLAYVPPLLLLFALAPMFFAYLTTDGVTSTYLTVLVLFSVAVIFGVFNLGNASQVEFGFWTVVPFLYGIVVLPAFLRAWTRVVPYAVFLWALVVGGVLINAFHPWPWIGFGYQLGATEIHASRAWDTEGFLRLPGFSVASFFAGPQILLVALFLRETLRTRWWIPMWVLSGIAIILTTSKTPLVIFIFFSVFWFFFRGKIRSRWRLVPMASAFLAVALPFSMLLLTGDWLPPIRSELWKMLISSFTARMKLGWPVWIRMAVEHGNWILGRGLGGIGTAQEHFEPWLFSPSDNMAVYVYATFGLLGLALMLLYGWKASRSCGDGPAGRFFFFIACVLMLGATTLSIMDASLLGVAFGLSLRYFQEVAPQARVRVPVRRMQRVGPIAPGNSQPQCT